MVPSDESNKSRWHSARQLSTVESKSLGLPFHYPSSGFLNICQIFIQKSMKYNTVPFYQFEEGAIWWVDFEWLKKSSIRPVDIVFHFQNTEASVSGLTKVQLRYRYVLFRHTVYNMSGRTLGANFCTWQFNLERNCGHLPLFRFCFILPAVG